MNSLFLQLLIFQTPILRRPNYLSRSNNLSGFLEEFPKPKFTRSVMSKPF